MPVQTAVTRPLGMIEFHQQAHERFPGGRRWLARGQNFFVEWAEAEGDGATLPWSSRYETMVLTFGASAQVSCGALQAQADAHSVCIVPPGEGAIRLAAGGACAVLASERDDLGGRAALNQADFMEPDTRIRPSTPPFRCNHGASTLRVLPIASFEAPASNPRLKMLQSATLSINWVQYEGPRDRSSLSPHSHADLEQGSLAVAGHFVHHLREPWGKDANQWRDDRHIEVGSPSLMLVPLNLIHTSEGVGAGRHVLIDIFSPPRRDFISRGWVHNAADYEDPSA
jgi:hypothetical protein